MKKMATLFSISMLFYSKDVGQEIPPAPADKAVVYFVQTATVLGISSKLLFMDSATLVANVKSNQYVRYECEPGHHLFSVKNLSFVDAELEVGKIYFLQVVYRTNLLGAWMELRPVDPSKGAVMKPIFNLMEKKGPESPSQDELKKISEEMQEAITKWLKRYKKLKERGYKADRLEKHMYYTPKI